MGTEEFYSGSKYVPASYEGDRKTKGGGGDKDGATGRERETPFGAEI